MTPKLLRGLLRPTHTSARPTDVELDHDIEYVAYIMRHVWPILVRIAATKLIRFIKYGWRAALLRVFVVACIAFGAWYAFVIITDLKGAIALRDSMKNDICVVYKSGLGMNMKNFLAQIAHIESRGNYAAVSGDGNYVGMFQFSQGAREASGYGDVPKDVFLRHPVIQVACMIAYLKHNKKVLAREINEYSGKIVDGVLVTESGILALSMLGCGYVKECLDFQKFPTEDKYGNPARSYVKLGGYDLNLDSYYDDGLAK